MKYTIEGFNQVELVKMGLNSNDAIILRWFVDFYATSKMAIVKNETGQEFKWVKYQAVIDDLPILGITNKSIKFFIKVDLPVLTGPTTPT